jgi:hypothetical protein
LPKNADEMRSLFVRMVMGDYLKCFYCDVCSAKFITNMKLKYKLLGNGCKSQFVREKMEGEGKPRIRNYSTRLSPDNIPGIMKE